MEEAVYDQVESFLSPLYASVPEIKDRPFITLTFAQSLDGMISKKGQQVLISGRESLAMTHRLRTLHQGIMVGIGTALVDDPQLNARYVSPTHATEQPQPIIMDPFLKLPPTCKLIQNNRSGKGKQVWLVASSKGYAAHKEKKELLQSLGVKILVVETNDDRLPLPQVFKLLKTQGIQTLMIEGGSNIIQSCLSSNAFDRLIITIAPMFMGKDGVPALTHAQDIKKLDTVTYTTLGIDMVMSATQ